MLHLPGPQILQQVVSLPGPLTPSSLPHLFCARAHSLCHRPGKASECAAACLCLGTGRNNAWWVCGQGPEGTMHGGSVVRDRKEQCMVGLWSGTRSGRNNAWWVCGQGPGPEGTMHGGSVVRDRKEQCMVGLWSGTRRNNAWWICGQGPGPEGTMHGGPAEALYLSLIHI